MKIRYLFIVLSVLISSCTSSLSIGEYKNKKDDWLISTLEIKNDSTFFYFQKGDIYYAETDGTWKVIGNKIFLKSYDSYKRPCLRLKDDSALFFNSDNLSETIVTFENNSTLSEELFNELEIQIENNTFKLDEYGEVRVSIPTDLVRIVLSDVFENEYNFKKKDFLMLDFEIVNGGCSFDFYLDEIFKIKNKKLLKFDGSLYKLTE